MGPPGSDDVKMYIRPLFLLDQYSSPRGPRPNLTSTRLSPEKAYSDLIAAPKLSYRLGGVLGLLSWSNQITACLALACFSFQGDPRVTAPFS